MPQKRRRTFTEWVVDPWTDSDDDADGDSHPPHQQDHAVSFMQDVLRAVATISSDPSCESSAGPEPAMLGEARPDVAVGSGAAPASSEPEAPAALAVVRPCSPQHSVQRSSLPSCWTQPPPEFGMIDIDAEDEVDVLDLAVAGIDSQDTQRERRRDAAELQDVRSAIWWRDNGERIEAERLQREMDEAAERARADLLAEHREQIYELMEREHRLLAEDGSNVQFCLVGGVDGQVGAGQQENEAVSVALLRIVRDADSFYVGGTKSPSWRWQGGVSDRSTKPMVGHSANWEVMKVIACRFDESAGELETFDSEVLGR